MVNVIALQGVNSGRKMGVTWQCGKAATQPCHLHVMAVWVQLSRAAGKIVPGGKSRLFLAVTDSGRPSPS